MESILGILVIVFYLFMIVVWIILPFAVFGIKKRLDKANTLHQAILTRLDLSYIRMSDDNK